MSADQTPQAPAAGSQPAADGPTASPRIFFPEQPAVPAPPPGSQLPPPPVQFQLPPPPARPTTPPGRELRQQALAATFFGLIGLLALATANQAGHASYLIIFALVIGAAAVLLGIWALRRAQRAATMRPRGAIAGIVMGSACVLLSGLAFMGIIFARQLASYEQCMNNAPTSASQQVCTQRLMNSLEHHRGS